MASSSGDPTPFVNGLSEGDIAKIVAALRNAKVVEDGLDRDRDRDKEKDGKRYWKTSDVGYFWPDMPLSYGAGRVIDFDGARYFRDVNAFVAQVKDSVAYYTADVVRNNLQNCLKGQAFIWYSDICPSSQKQAFRNDATSECTNWTAALIENFKQSGARAMDQIASEHTRYTMQMLKSGVSLVSWFTDMISLATDAEFNDDQKLRFVWHKMDAELRDRIPALKDSHNIQSYLNALRNSEEDIREAVRAQDRRLAAQLRPSNDWRTANRRPTNAFTPRPYMPNQDSRFAPQNPPASADSATPPKFSQYIPEAFKQPIGLIANAPGKPGADDYKGKSKMTDAEQRPQGRPNWASGPLGARKDSFRVNPKRNCRHCGGYHYDSMCRQRSARTPRVYYYEMDDVPLYTVDATGDDEYDDDHQEFVSTYFANGHSMDDFYRLCDSWQDYQTHDIVECGLAEAASESIRPLKAPPTTAVHHTAATHRPSRFADTTMRVPTPKSSSKDIPITIHHVEEEEEKQHQCHGCAAKFRMRNKLFQHLRTTNHYMSSDTDSAMTPNDPSAEHDPDIVKSTAVPTFGSGYAFRTYNYLEMKVRLTKMGPDTWVCLDTGAGMSLIDRGWLREMCPDANILTRASGVSVRGIDNKSQLTSSYVVLQILIPVYDKETGKQKLAEIRREFHIVADLRCKMIIGEDIIEPEGIVIDSQDRTAWIKSCGDVRFKLQITPKGRHVMHRRVRTAKRITVPPGTKIPVPIQCKTLPDNRDFEFTPVYDSNTAHFANVGGFLRAVIDSETDSVVFHNRSCDTVVIPKNTKIGYIADLSADTFHTRFDPEEHPDLFDCAENGTWKKGAIAAAAVSVLACSAASRMFGMANSKDTKWESCTDVTLSGIQPHAGPNEWSQPAPHTAKYDGYGTTDHHGNTFTTVNSTLSDAIYNMATAANEVDWPAAIREVDINRTDEIMPSQCADLVTLIARYSDLFEDKGTVANEHEDEHMKITLKPGAELPNKGPYNNSEKDKKVIDETFDKYHRQGKMGWAQQGVKAAWPAFVVWQKDKGRVVTDIRGLNARVWKDPYPMPRQEDILQAIKGCSWISTLDLTAAFMQRTLHTDSRHLVTVVTHRGLEYFKVVPFGYTNSPAHMQRFMDGRLRNLRSNVRCYIDDIVIHSRTFEDHMRHLKDVFEVLREAGLYLSPKKCHVGYHSVTLLGRTVNSLGLATLRERAQAIQSLTFPTTLKQLEGFIGSANYNRTHIPHYAALIAPLEQLKRELLRESPAKGAQRKRYTAKFRLDSPTEAQKASFQGIKDALSGPTMLIHYDNSVPLVIRMDASKERGYGATITQIPTWSFDAKKKASTVLNPDAEGYDSKLEQPICYLSKRLNKHEINYWPTELEVAGLVWTVRKIRHLVDDSKSVFVFTDHQATKGIAAQENFRHSAPHRQNLRLVRASLYLSQFPQIKILHIPGKLNVMPDALSRLQSLQADDITDEEDIYEALHLQASMLRISDDLIEKFQRGYSEDPYYKTKFAEMKRQYSKNGSLPIEYNNLVLEDAEINAFTPPAKEPLTLNSRRYLLYLRDGERLRLCIPRSLHAPFLQMAHDRNNHSGVERTYQKLRQSYFIKGCSSVVKDYIRHCPSCLINKPTNFTPSGRLMPISAPASPWELVTMDFVVKLPPCKPKTGLWSQLTGHPNTPAYDSFLTITDKLTKYVVLVPGCETWTAQQWAEAYFEKVFPTFGVPAAMISDRGSVFVSLFWTTIFKMMKTDCIATTAYNPRSDGQSERTNQVVEIALRHFVNSYQNDWADHLGEIQFAMNNSPNASTGVAPNELLMAFTPRSAVDIPAGHVQTRGQVQEATNRAASIQRNREEARDAIRLAEFTMASTYDKGHRITDISVGDRVFINLAKRTEAEYSVPGIKSPKLGPQRIGPFLVTEMCGPNACRVDIPSDWKIWPVISIRHLVKAPATPDTYERHIPSSATPVEQPHDVEEVLDMRVMHGKKEYFVKYVGLPITRCEWIDPHSMESAREKFEAFDQLAPARSLKRKRNDKDEGRKAKK
jgi:hypothetical protein